RDAVTARLAEVQQTVRPELVAFGAHEYSADFVKETDEIARRAGIGSLVAGELLAPAKYDRRPL
ncbi:MAG TPA: hypothetical protein VEJ84_17500, partial [Acidimicrobiales bacterium]|nr:hypothetical protein [Acidimicrobiales bacterium]